MIEFYDYRDDVHHPQKVTTANCNINAIFLKKNPRNSFETEQTQRKDRRLNTHNVLSFELS